MVGFIMTINFDLEELRNDFDCVNYFETGLSDPRIDVRCRKALDAKFKKVYSLELRKDRSGPRFSDRGLSVFCFALKLSCLSSLWCPDRSEMAPRAIVFA